MADCILSLPAFNYLQFSFKKRLIYPCKNEFHSSRMPLPPRGGTHLVTARPRVVCTPGAHHLPEFAQVHIHCTGDAVQPSHTVIPSFPFALDLSSIRNFSNESSVCTK